MRKILIVIVASLVMASCTVQSGYNREAPDGVDRANLVIERLCANNDIVYRDRTTGYRYVWSPASYRPWWTPINKDVTPQEVCY